ncbi:MAG TPA: hypothetical protein VN842_01875 [Thermoplasmata archaeon]|nr:hypothetical protein [Thermoplasmata archaeon]
MGGMNDVDESKKKDPLEGWVVGYHHRLVLGRAWLVVDGRTVPVTDPEQLVGSAVMLHPCHELRVDLIKSGPGIAQSIQVLPLFNLLYADAMVLEPGDWRMPASACSEEERRIFSERLPALDELIADMRSSSKRAAGGPPMRPRIVLPGGS